MTEPEEPDPAPDPPPSEPSPPASPPVSLPEPAPPPDEPPAEADDAAQVRDKRSSEVKRSTAKRAVQGRPRAGLMSSEELRDQINRQTLEAREQTLELRRRYAKYLLRVLILQLVLADIVFVVYAIANDWQLGAAAIEVWLAATVVEVVGLVIVIVKYLFSDDPPV